MCQANNHYLALTTTIREVDVKQGLATKAELPWSIDESFHFISCVFFNIANNTHTGAAGSDVGLRYRYRYRQGIIKCCFPRIKEYRDMCYRIESKPVRERPKKR